MYGNTNIKFMKWECVVVMTVADFNIIGVDRVEGLKPKFRGIS
jgi:hypothetical protein